MRSDETHVDDLLSVGQVSQRLACSTGTVYRLIASGDLPAVRLGAVGASLRVNERELEGWLRARDTRRERQPAPPRPSLINSNHEEPLNG
jgi:excisionase family DNA binding protein